MGDEPAAFTAAPVKPVAARATAGLAQGWEAAHRELSEKLVASYKGDRTKPLRIAVSDFTTTSGADCALGAAVAEVLGNDLFEAREFMLVERKMLDKILKEQGVSHSQLTDPETAARLGKLAGVGGLVVGTITGAAGEFVLSARIVQVETATRLASASVRLRRSSGEEIARCDGGSAPAGRGTPEVPAAPAAEAGPAQPSYVQGLKFEYFNMPPWSGSAPPTLAGMEPAKVFVSSALEQSPEYKSPAQGVSATFNSLRITGEIRIEAGGTHRLAAEGYGCGSQVTVNVTIGTNSITCGQEQRFYRAGWYPFAMTVHTGARGANKWEFKWQRPGDSELVSIAAPLLRTTTTPMRTGAVDPGAPMDAPIPAPGPPLATAAVPAQSPAASRSAVSGLVAGGFGVAALPGPNPGHGASSAGILLGLEGGAGWRFLSIHAGGNFGSLRGSGSEVGGLEQLIAGVWGGLGLSAFGSNNSAFQIGGGVGYWSHGLTRTLTTKTDDQGKTVADQRETLWETTNHYLGWLRYSRDILGFRLAYLPGDTPVVLATLELHADARAYQ